MGEYKQKTTKDVSISNLSDIICVYRGVHLKKSHLLKILAFYKIFRFKVSNKIFSFKIHRFCLSN